MTQLVLQIALLLLLTVPAQAARPSFAPECPLAGHATCADGRDNDGDERVDESPTSAAFASVTGGYAAEFESGGRTATIEIVADGVASGGNAVRLSQGKVGGAGQVWVCGNFTNGAYYVFIHAKTAAAVASPVTNTVWVDTIPIPSVPSNSTAAMLFTPESTYGWVGPVGRDLNFLTGVHGTSQATFTLNGEACLYVAPSSVVTLDAIYVSTSPTTVPVLPSAAGGTPTPDYTILEKGTNAITHNGACTEGVWGGGGANVVQFRGVDNTTTSDVSFQFVWENAATDRLHFCAKWTDADLQAAASSNDSSAIFNDDGPEFHWKSDQTQTFTATTYKLAVSANVTPNYLDRNYPNGSANNTYNGNCTLTRGVSGNTYTIEGACDLGFDGSAQRFGLCNFMLRDRDAGTGASVLQRISYSANLGQFNDISTWGLCEYSPTSLGTLTTPDTTAPTVTSPAASNVGTNAATVTANTNEEGVCRVRYGTSTGSYPNASGTTSSNNGTCLILLSALAAATQYFAVVDVTDAAGNTGTSSEITFTTAAASTDGVGPYFVQPSTWYKLIATDQAGLVAAFANPHPNSAAFVNDIKNNTSSLTFSRTQYGNRLCTATPSDPIITVSGIKTGAQEQGWHQGRMPAECVPPGGTDGWVSVVNEGDGYVWELYAAKKTDATTWSASSARKWPLTGRGHLNPYDNIFGGAVWACTASARIHGTVRKEELDAGEIKHAIAFAYWGERKPDHWGFVPCNAYRAGISDRPAAGYLGERLMLDPNIDVNALAVGKHTKIILRAMQKYGFIFSYNSCLGCGQLLLESDTGKSWSWGSYDFSGNIKDLVFNNMRRIPCVASYSGECPSGQ